MRTAHKKTVARRSKNLSDGAIEQIVRILDAWSEAPLSWNALMDAVALRLHCRYTRQALHKHERIRAAFALRKGALRGVQTLHRRGVASPGMAERVSRLEAENQRLEAENQRLLEQFVTWAYNAHSRGLTQDFLSQPLPRVNRGQTRHGGGDTPLKKRK